MSMSVDAGVSVERVKELEQEIEELTNEIKRLKKRKKYGLVWEDHVEELDKKNVIPLLAKDEVLSLPKISDKPMNYLIEGDNYHALKALQHTHRGRIDVIYIDPPYNTGNEFVYNDKIVDREDSFRHSKWLSFMNKRLRLARELMSDNGVIFISIDDNELAQLKLLCDEIFGERNFVANMPRKTVSHIRKSADYELQNLHDYVLMYAKHKDSLVLNKKMVGYHNFPHVDAGGAYRLKPFQNSGENGTRTARPNLYYPIYYNENTMTFSLENENDGFIKILPQKVKNDDGRWLWSKKKFLSDKSKLVYHNGKIYRKEYESEVTDKVKYQTYKTWLDNYHNRLGSEKLNDLGMSGVFTYPKPMELVMFLLKIATNENSIVLDFFAGSGTTGHAVMELNKEDGGNRSFILCTNNEVSDERVQTYLFEQGFIPKNNKTEFNKYKKNNPEDYQNFLKSPEYESLGIARAVTRERLKRVIEGYTTPKGKDVAPLPNNLTYLKTQEFDKNEQFGPNRKQLADLVFNSHLLKYPESDYQSIKVDIFTDLSQIEIDKTRKLVAFIDVRDRESLSDIVDELTERFGNHIEIETLESYFN